MDSFKDFLEIQFSSIQTEAELVEDRVIILEAGQKSGYSDEHAFVKVWNHAVKEGIVQDKEAMHKAIDDAQSQDEENAKKSKPSKKGGDVEPPKHHELSFYHESNDVDKKDNKGFVGGKKDENSKKGYYAELHHAADTIHTVANHPDFKGAVEEKAQASVAGASHGKVTDRWARHGATNATSKADLKIGDSHKISYKKSGGSQLMSAEPAETKATYKHVITHMRMAGKVNTTQAKKMFKHADEAAKNMDAMRDVDPKDPKRDDKLDALKNEAQKHIDAIHNEHPEVTEHLHHEAASGNHKFGVGNEGSATHILSSYNEKAQSANLHHVDDYHKGKIKLAHPRVAKPKGKSSDGRSRPGNLKLDIRD